MPLIIRARFYMVLVSLVKKWFRHPGTTRLIVFEIYQALQIDPKEARRQRASKKTQVLSLRYGDDFHQFVIFKNKLLV